MPMRAPHDDAPDDPLTKSGDGHDENGVKAAIAHGRTGN
jgi:hypothetical protein